MRIPQTIEIEHEELHEELARAMKAGGKTGEAARSVMRVAQAHMAREEELVRPALALLAPLAAGEFPSDAAAIVARTEVLRRDLPRMLGEHKLIVDGLRVLMQAAIEEQKPGYAKFAQKLISHAQTEEEILYPAALLVGDYVRDRLRP